MLGPETAAFSGAPNPEFWRSRRVLVTGHTGFKGAWLSLWLQSLGAEVTGFAQATPTSPSLFSLASVDSGMETVVGDVRDYEALRAVVAETKPEVVLHLAAQPMVRRSFSQPRETYETNVMGSVNLLEAIRSSSSDHTAAVVNVTSDKCYDNRELGVPFVESDPMGGHDPYSNSKGCAELVTDAFRRSFFSEDSGPRIASGRAGNVIGGGDWGEDRLVPDIIRAATANRPVAIRRPDAIRPWQHVLNPLAGYLAVAEAVCSDQKFASGWNFGPSSADVKPVSWIVERLTELWPGTIEWDIDPGPHPHEAHYLALDSGKAREQLGWIPRWDLQRAIEAIVEWHVAHQNGANLRELTLNQIREYSHA